MAAPLLSHHIAVKPTPPVPGTLPIYYCLVPVFTLSFFPRAFLEEGLCLAFLMLSTDCPEATTVLITIACQYSALPSYLDLVLPPVRELLPHEPSPAHWMCLL